MYRRRASCDQEATVAHEPGEADQICLLDVLRGSFNAALYGSVPCATSGATERALLGVSVRLTPGDPRPNSRTLTMDDPLWSVVGLIKDAGPTDASSNKHKYLTGAPSQPE